MNAADVPVLGWVLRSGARSRTFDVLLLCGPLLVALIAIAGRNLLTTTFAVLYVLVFVGYIGYRSIS
jgi:hypothetical protein